MPTSSALRFSSTRVVGAVIGPLGDAEETAAADIDPHAADQAQQRGSGINPRQNRRTDVYRLWLEGEEL